MARSSPPFPLLAPTHLGPNAVQGPVSEEGSRGHCHTHKHWFGEGVTGAGAAGPWATADPPVRRAHTNQWRVWHRAKGENLSSVFLSFQAPFLCLRPPGSSS